MTEDLLGDKIQGGDVVQLFFMLKPPSSQISVIWFLRTEEPLSLEDQMTLKRNPLSSAAFLIILIKVFITLSLTCHPAEYLIGSECCPRCSAGSRVKTHCNEYRSTSCLPCVDGTFTDKPNGLEQCTPCTNCAAGSGLKVKRSCTGTSDTVCEPLQGFYCIYSVGDDCETAQRHSSCGPGQYISKHGTASTDTECSDCSAGTFSDGTSASCQPHTQCEDLNLQEITAGTSAADAQCGERGVDVGAAVGVSVALVLIIVAVIVLLWYLRKKRKSSSSSPKTNKEEEGDLPFDEHRGSSKTDEERGDDNRSVKEHHEGVHNGLLPSSDVS
ncbi:tumor necrosis factor receptor superfamily member 14-like isoform X1 [Archocentrus centrarchus]|uniref:tumor necrosis factor receptor superfamily member 14-like isoform X1 n=2 Tax=Archocentrus centrarchus TaxID=63155 RepID=UPI0011EA3036|nr:tumor necrosis factor receptor superfamily member 14-like isoform X1 [Archocentrus centrarchus]XP_030601492.1 tumor necrosis factor receptor superfamily member 14-like isoform X1 [Archocentrus centrarchus]